MPRRALLPELVLPRRLGTAPEIVSRVWAQHGTGDGVVESVALEFARMSMSLICRARFRPKLEPTFAGKWKQLCKNAGPKLGSPGDPSFGVAAFLAQGSINLSSP